jgi:antitoxin component of MazEF toxin-antitoxin module
MKFHTTILQDGNNTGISVPPEIVEALGAGKRPKIVVTLNGGYTYRNSIAPMGGAYMISVSKAVRESAGVKGGDEVDVDIELDTAPREVTVPPDLQAALDADAEAKAFFEKLSYSNKLRHVLAIEDAKSPETRQKRIAKSVALFHEGKS